MEYFLETGYRPMLLLSINALALGMIGAKDASALSRIKAQAWRCMSFAKRFALPA